MPTQYEPAYAKGRPRWPRHTVTDVMTAKDWQNFAKVLYDYIYYSQSQVSGSSPVAAVPKHEQHFPPRFCKQCGKEGYKGDWSESFTSCDICWPVNASPTPSSEYVKALEKDLAQWKLRAEMAVGIVAPTEKDMAWAREQAHPTAYEAGERPKLPKMQTYTNLTDWQEVARIEIKNKWDLQEHIALLEKYYARLTQSTGKPAPLLAERREGEKCEKCDGEGMTPEGAFKGTGAKCPVCNGKGYKP